MGQADALVRVVAQAEVEGQPGVLHAAGRIDPRGETEGDVGGDERGGDRGSLGQGAKPRQLQDAAQTAADDGPVLAAERHHVSDRPQRGETDEGLRLTGGHDPLGFQSAEQLPGHAGPGETVEAVGVGRLLGVDQGVGGRQPGWAAVGGERQVVVGHHQGHPRRPVGGDLDRAGAAVDGDHTADPLGGQLLQGRGVEPVALGHPVGDVGEDVGAACPERPGQHRAGGHPISVVVPVDGDAPAFGDGHAEGDDGIRHPLQPKGIEQLHPPGEEGGGFSAVQTSTRQDAAEHERLPGNRESFADLPAAGGGLHALDNLHTNVRITV